MLNLISAHLPQPYQFWHTWILSHINSSLISFIQCVIYLDGLNITHLEDKGKSQSNFCISKILSQHRMKFNSKVTYGLFSRNCLCPIHTRILPCNTHQKGCLCLSVSVSGSPSVSVCLSLSHTCAEAVRCKIHGSFLLHEAGLQ